MAVSQQYNYPIRRAVQLMILQKELKPCAEFNYVENIEIENMNMSLDTCNEKVRHANEVLRQYLNELLVSLILKY